MRLTAIVALYIIFAVGSGCSTRRAASFPPYPFALPPADAALLARLRATSLPHFHYRNIPNFAAHFGARLGVSVQVAVEVDTRETACHARWDNLPADETLSFVLNILELGWVIREGRIVILSSEEAARDPFTIRMKAIDSLAEARRRLDAAANPRPDPEILRIEEKRRTLRLDLDFKDASIFEIVDFLRDFTQLNMTFSPDLVKSADPERRLALKHESASLDEIFTSLGLVAEVRHRVLFLISREAFESGQKLRAEQAARRQASLSQRLALEYASVPLCVAATDLASRSHLELRMEESLWDGRTRVTLSGDQTVEEALNAMADQSASRWILEEGVVYFVTKE